MASDITIDIYADIVCPWCYIGRAHLKQALDRRPDLNATLRWRPFQLQPEMPAEGNDFRTVLERKFGSWNRALQVFERIQQMGANHDLAFNFEAIERAPNTVDAHRLVLWAEDQDRGDAMADALFRAYFAEGQDVTDRAVLTSCAPRVGLDRERAGVLLDGTEYMLAVQKSQEEARRQGVTGVPCYVFEKRRAVTGAQSADVLIQVNAVVPVPTAAK